MLPSPVYAFLSLALHLINKSDCTGFRLYILKIPCEILGFHLQFALGHYLFATWGPAQTVLQRFAKSEPWVQLCILQSSSCYSHIINKHKHHSSTYFTDDVGRVRSWVVYHLQTFLFPSFLYKFILVSSAQRFFIWNLVGSFWYSMCQSLMWSTCYKQWFAPCCKRFIFLDCKLVFLIMEIILCSCSCLLWWIVDLASPKALAFSLIDFFFQTNDCLLPLHQHLFMLRV